MTDTQGFLVDAVVHAADVQDRDGASRVLTSILYAIHGCAISLPMAGMQERN